MKRFFCDVCGDEVINPVTDLSFFYICENSLCEPCKETLNAKLKSMLRAEEQYLYGDYEETVKELVEKAKKTKHF